MRGKLLKDGKPERGVIPVCILPWKVLQEGSQAEAVADTAGSRTLANSKAAGTDLWPSKTLQILPRCLLNARNPLPREKRSCLHWFYRCWALFQKLEMLF